MKIGFLGGGQLAKMMAMEAKRLGFRVATLDPSPEAPARTLSDEFIRGRFDDARALTRLVRTVDVTTFDIEHIRVAPLKALEERGFKIHPSPRILELIQDKWHQKEHYVRHRLPVPRGLLWPKRDIKTAREFGLPAVQKLRFGGYDGKGVKFLKSPSDVKKSLEGESYLEERINIQKELALLVARSARGEIKVYPLVEMVFRPETNSLDFLKVPAKVSKSAGQEAVRIAKRAVESFRGVGIFGVELFLAKDGRVYLNEIAPRPHNSGHYTIEACATSQFEQHIRAILNLPLGDASLVQPAAMFNLLAEPGPTGPPKIEGLVKAMAVPGVFVHIYGKSEARPYRKMGHVTVVGKTREEAERKALKVRRFLKIRGAKRG